MSFWTFTAICPLIIFFVILLAWILDEYKEIIEKIFVYIVFGIVILYLVVWVVGIILITIFITS